MPALLTQVAPILLTKDIRAAVQFWEERVGFVGGELHGEPPTFAMPSRDGVTIMLAQLPAGTATPLPHWKIVDKTSQIYIWVDDANALYDELRERGAPIDFTIYDTPWGTREFGIQDLDEHDISFGQRL